jgi:AhpD family alkylhydroperoxidase
MDPRVFRRVQRYGWDAAAQAYDRGWVPLLERLTESCVARAQLTPSAGVAEVSFARCDMESTGAPGCGFDAVTCAFGLMFAADRAAAFAEIARVVAPGGRVSVCVWGRRTACGFAPVFSIVDAPGLETILGRDARGRARAVPGVAGAVPPGRSLRRAGRGGLRDRAQAPDVSAAADGTFRSLGGHASGWKANGGKPEASRSKTRTTIRRQVMKTIKLMKMVTVAVAALAFAPAARAEDKPAAAAKADIQKTLGFVPQFFARFPDEALPGTWEEMKTLQMNPHTALNGRTKELIGLGVAAQVPCHYCIYAHTEFARLNGASETEIGEAVAMAGLTRHWSTFLNGIQTDEGKFRGEIGKIVENVKKASASKSPPPAPVNVVDGASALKEATQMLGYVPDFLRAFPDEARAGVWRAFRDVQLSPATALSGKQKELVGLAVASQIPCRFCIIAHTEFARLNGASDAEIKEAIGMASLTRDMSTLLNGLQVDEPQFHRDVDRLVKAAKKNATTAQR